MNKIIYIIFLIVGCTATSFAQQESQFTQFMYNQQIINPAYVGSRGAPSVSALYRDQWIGFDGSPRVALAAFNMPIFGDRIGFGLSVFNQQVGITNTWYSTMAYSYNLKVAEDVNLRLGVQASMKYIGINFTDESARILNPGDPSVAEGQSTNQYRGNVGLGAYLTFSDNLYVGVSSPYLYSNNISFNDETNRPAIEQAHYYGMVGGMLPLSDKIELKPALLAKYTQNAPFDLDIHASLVFDRLLSAGATYRLGGMGSGESIDLLIFYQISTQVGLGVAYDFALSDISNYTNGTFETMLRFDIKNEKTQLENPRFF
ncbi:MAG: type IX secretion system membrane protein PorP/SprF [Saprospiraceae bacterium]